jgi:triacylglycerol lipase
MLTDSQAGALGQFVWYAAAMHATDPDSLAPAPDPRLSPRWKILGYLTAVDCLFRRGQTVAFGEDTCYGYLAQVQGVTPGTFIVALRGTAGILEWILDGQFTTMPHPVAGRVETGFWSVYESLTYRPLLPVTGPTPSRAPAVSAAQGIAAAVGDGDLIVLGHSMGSALATYLTFDLASKLGDRVQLCTFASPRPGDAEFATAFAERVLTSVVYNYELDVVPRVPRGLGYTDLSSVHWIGIQEAQAHIKFELTCHHHILSYIAMLNYKLLDWTHMPLADQGCAACIKGPTIKAT